MKPHDDPQVEAWMMKARSDLRMSGLALKKRRLPRPRPPA